MLKYFHRTSTLRKFFNTKIFPTKILYNENFPIYGSGKLSREKTFANWWKIWFRGENFHRLLAHAMLNDTTPPNFAEKTLANSHNTTKLTKVFSLESFLLYGAWYDYCAVYDKYCNHSQTITAGHSGVQNVIPDTQNERQTTRNSKTTTHLPHGSYTADSCWLCSPVQNDIAHFQCAFSPG